MGQIEIYEFLKKNKKKKYTVKELSDNMDVTVGSVCEAVKRMRKLKVVNFEKKERPFSNCGRRMVMVHWYKEC
jgi:Mn-dependent DtxR family transcriptional regulator